MKPRRGVAAVVGLTLAASAALLPLAPADAAELPVIVRSTDGDIAALIADIEALGGTVERELGIIGGVSATIPEHRRLALEAQDNILAVTFDGEVHLSQVDDIVPGEADLVQVAPAEAVLLDAVPGEDAPLDEVPGAEAPVEEAVGEEAVLDAVVGEDVPLEATLGEQGSNDDPADDENEDAADPEDGDDDKDDEDDDLPEDEGHLDWVREVTGAEAMHAAGLMGAGVDIAIIDSGVTRVRGFKEADKLVIGPDLSFENDNDELRGRDSFGHGTHLAGIINGDDKKGDDLGDTYGIAPMSRLVSIKAADATGATDVSQVIAAIDWVVQHGQDGDLNVRVLNLAFGTDSNQSYLIDPLSYAAENAWKHGIVVVVAAGNRGEVRTGLDNPAHNPYMLAVGATDTSGTLDVADDTVPAWSAKGDGNRNPDIVAPGRSIVSYRVKNSFVDVRFGDIAKVDKHTLKGSGTSQASAVVSGLAALLLEAHPDWTPDQVKTAFQATAHDLPSFGPEADGHGVVNVARAAEFEPGHVMQIWPSASGTGSLEASRGSANVVFNGVPISGEQTAFGNDWVGATWTGNAWSGNAWSGGEWTGNAWSGNAWSGNAWSGNAWSGGTWSGNAWSGNAWSGNAWSGATWSGDEWSGNAWSSAEWQGDNWNATKWG